MICCEKYNKQLKSKVMCNNPSCEFSACKSCIRHYLINSTEDIHCMSCRKAWDNTFVILNLNRNWFVNTYTPHHVDLLFERNKSRIQEVMPQAQIRMEQIRRFKIIEPEIIANNNKMKELDKKRKNLFNEYRVEAIKIRTNCYSENDEEDMQKEKIKIANCYSENDEEDMQKEKIKIAERKVELMRKKWYDERRQLLMRRKWYDKRRQLQADIRALMRRNFALQDRNRLEQDEKKEKTKTKFIMPCQHEKCKGFLNENYICGLCDEKCCKKCFEMLGNNEDEIKTHECNKEQVETAKLINSTTKPCPKCGQRIHKVSGCDQMWCIECKTSFSWKTGELVNGVIHNPHYFQYLRENTTNGEIPRQPGDIPCDNNMNDILIHIMNYFRIMEQKITHGALFVNINKISEKKIIQTCDVITSFHRMVNHVEFVNLPNIRREIEYCANYQIDLVSWIVDNNDNKYKEQLKIKHAHRTKNIDKGYIYEMYVNVGKDILIKMLTKLEEKGITKCSIEEFEIIVTETENEIINFLEYYNEQNKIISVSHKCTTNNHIKTKNIAWGQNNLGRYDTFTIKECSIKSKIREIKGKISN